MSEWYGRFAPLHRWLLYLLIGGLLLFCILSFKTVWSHAVGAAGSIDLHPYWYYGHFARMGMNPYDAYATNRALPGPVHYWDGSVAAPEDVFHPKLARIPANTAPILLVSSLLSFFPWDQVKYLWLFVNLALVVSIPWLALRMLPVSMQLSPPVKWLAVLSFYAMRATRESVSNGQFSLFVFFMMIVTLILPESYWLLAGLTLGLALGKYSMALPICIYLLLAKRFRVLIVAGVVQAVALVVVAALNDGVPNRPLWERIWGTLGVFWRMVGEHAALPGVNISYVLSSYPILAMVGVVLITVVTLIAVAYSRQRRWTAVDLLPVNSGLVLWILLVVYHRHYDTIMIELFFILALSVIALWPVTAEQKLMLGACYGVSLLFAVMPRNFWVPLLEQADVIGLWLDNAFTVIICVIWAVNVWLMMRTPRRPLTFVE